MNITILGTGGVGQALASALVRKNHSVAVVTRDVSATKARQGSDSMGTPSWSAFAQQNPQVRLISYADIGPTDLFVNATSGHASLEALHAVGAARLAGKVVVDIANPLDFSRGFPPSLTVCNTDSLGEQLQAAFPGTRVVKTLNIVSNAVMVDPNAVPGGQPTMFVSGNDAEAKAQVTRWLTDAFGWKDIVDLGDITTARGTEMLLPIWVRTFSVLKTPLFGFKVVR